PAVPASVPPGQPALARAHQTGEKLSQVGFDWPDLAGVLAKLDEERHELAGAVGTGDRQAAGRELGDLLLTLTSVARHLELDAEMALRDATSRLARRVAHVEAAARAGSRSLGPLAAAPRAPPREEPDAAR